MYVTTVYVYLAVCTLTDALTVSYVKEIYAVVHRLSFWKICNQKLHILEPFLYFQKERASSYIYQTNYFTARILQQLDSCVNIGLLSEVVHHNFISS